MIDKMLSSIEEVLIKEQPDELLVYADMIDAITNNRKPYIDAVAGRNGVEMVLAIYQSAATGKPVKLPLKDVASTDFTGRFDK